MAYLLPPFCFGRKIFAQKAKELTFALSSCMSGGKAVLLRVRMIAQTPVLELTAADSMHSKSSTCRVAGFGGCAGSGPKMPAVRSEHRNRIGRRSCRIGERQRVDNQCELPAAAGGGRLAQRL